MVRFGICDDDIKYIESVESIICESFKQQDIFQEECQCILYSSGKELIERFIQDEIDIFFIDIECGEMSGFDIARQMIQKKRNLGIVYITNHMHYISDAFVCRPLGFICKDNFREDLRIALISIVDFLKETHQILTFYKGRKKKI
ncbi:MAG: response regulator [Lachnospira sp.]